MRKRNLLLTLLWPTLLTCRQDGEAPDLSLAGRVGQAARPDRLTTVAFHEVGTRPRAVAVADVDGDGRSDVAVANAGDGTVTVLFGDDAGGLGRSASLAGGEPSDVDALDLDRDGDVDLVFANHETSGITVLLNDGRGAFTPASGSPFDTGARPHIHGLATGDFDGDGRVDVAVESADTRAIHILLGTPSGPSTPVVVPVGVMPYSRLRSERLAGDGRRACSGTRLAVLDRRGHRSGDRGPRRRRLRGHRRRSVGW